METFCPLFQQYWRILERIIGGVWWGEVGEVWKGRRKRRFALASRVD